jgi:hypothetical protein
MLINLADPTNSPMVDTRAGTSRVLGTPRQIKWSISFISAIPGARRARELAQSDPAKVKAPLFNKSHTITRDLFQTPGWLFPRIKFKFRCSIGTFTPSSFF